MDTFDRVIHVNDKIEIHVKIDKDIDVLAANAESLMLSRIAKAIEKLDNVEGLTGLPEDAAIEKTEKKKTVRKGAVDVGDEDKFLKEVERVKGQEARDLAKRYGFSNANAMRVRAYNIRDRRGKK